GRVWYTAQMKTGSGLIVGQALMALAGVAAARGEERPDFSGPEALQKILGEAILQDTLKQPGLLYHLAGNPEPSTG
ncbi:MAG: hypothetical protein ACR2RV_04135, partial [Verrucomicrobiales bacterium]